MEQQYISRVELINDGHRAVEEIKVIEGGNSLSQFVDFFIPEHKEVGVWQSDRRP